MCHQPRTRRRTTHIRRFRHICAVDPGYVVDRVPSVSIPSNVRIRRVVSRDLFYPVSPYLPGEPDPVDDATY